MNKEQIKVRNREQISALGIGIMKSANKLKESKSKVVVFTNGVGQKFFVLTEEQLNLILK